jgi:hypothetical protein
LGWMQVQCLKVADSALWNSVNNDRAEIRRVTRDLHGNRKLTRYPSAKLLVSKAGEAYDAPAECLNRSSGLKHTIQRDWQGGR